jgi:hypothetical protein
MATIGRSKSDYGTAEDYFPITPNDAADLSVDTREIVVAVGGNLALMKVDGTTVVLTLPAGRFAFRVRRVLATGTTASGITGVV